MVVVPRPLDANGRAGSIAGVLPTETPGGEEFHSGVWRVQQVRPVQICLDVG